MLHPQFLELFFSLKLKSNTTHSLIQFVFSIHLDIGSQTLTLAFAFVASRIVRANEWTDVWGIFNYKGIFIL